MFLDVKNKTMSRFPKGSNAQLRIKNFIFNFQFSIFNFQLNNQASPKNKRLPAKSEQSFIFYGFNFLNFIIIFPSCTRRSAYKHCIGKRIISNLFLNRVKFQLLIQLLRNHAEAEYLT